MPSCYKCECPVPEGEVECEACKSGMTAGHGPGGQPAPDEILRQFNRFKKKFLAEIDWDKVFTADPAESIANMKKVFATMNPMIPRNSPEYFTLLPFIKTSPPAPTNAEQP